MEKVNDVDWLMGMMHIFDWLSMDLDNWKCMDIFTIDKLHLTFATSISGVIHEQNHLGMGHTYCVLLTDSLTH